MSTQSKWFWAVGILTAIAALLAFGVPTQTLLIVGLLVLCPLMMFFMMGSKNMHGRPDKDQSGGPSATHRDIPGKKSR